MFKKLLIVAAQIILTVTVVAVVYDAVEAAEQAAFAAMLKKQ